MVLWYYPCSNFVDVWWCHQWGCSSWKPSTRSVPSTGRENREREGRRGNHSDPPTSDWFLEFYLHGNFLTLGFWSHESLWFCKYLSHRMSARSQSHFYSNFGEREYVRWPGTGGGTRGEGSVPQGQALPLRKPSGARPGSTLWTTMDTNMSLDSDTGVLERTQKRNFLHSLMEGISRSLSSEIFLSFLIKLLSRELRKGRTWLLLDVSSIYLVLFGFVSFCFCRSFSLLQTPPEGPTGT